MGGEDVLKPPALGAFALAFALVGLGAVARAQDDADDSLRRPERITVGTNDQFLGQLAPDQKKVYFVSTRATRKEIFAQDIDEGTAKIVFDEGAEVTWPRLSPDGR